MAASLPLTRVCSRCVPLLKQGPLLPSTAVLSRRSLHSGRPRPGSPAASSPRAPASRRLTTLLSSPAPGAVDELPPELLPSTSAREENEPQPELKITQAAADVRINQFVAFIRRREANKRHDYAYWSVQQLNRIQERDRNPNLALRVSVVSGGCHGYQYKMDLVEGAEADD